jgi:hypothetical protein
LSTEGEEVSAFDKCRLELFFGAMVFKPNRQARRPLGTGQVLNWVAYGLWEETKKKEDKHVLSEEEELEKKELRAEYNRNYNRSWLPANKKRQCAPAGLMAHTATTSCEKK